MGSAIFSNFRLVGGTSLSLQLGHRLSVDIDLFSDQAYGTIDFGAINDFFEEKFSYVATSTNVIASFGGSYLVGNSAMDAVKVDVFYTDEFIDASIQEDGIRMASTKEIAAMKLDVISRDGRKKDFWDLHELLTQHTIPQMMEWHEVRYPYTHDATAVLKQLTNFEKAEGEFNPICLRGKYWDVIKLDIIEIIEELRIS